RPDRVANDIVFLRPFAFQHRLGFAVATLLPQISPHGITPVMPDHCPGSEAQSPTLLLQPPADVHVVARDMELRIKPADGLERHPAKGHVATRKMLRFPIRD